MVPHAGQDEHGAGLAWRDRRVGRGVVGGCWRVSWAVKAGVGCGCGSTCTCTYCLYHGIYLELNLIIRVRQ